MRFSKLVLLCTLSLSSLACIADHLTRSNFEQSFIGKEWRIGDYENKNIPHISQCVLDGGGLSSPIYIGYLNCKEKFLMLLGTPIENKLPLGDPVRILDALQLPRIKSNEEFMEAGDCKIKGNTEPYFIARVNLGHRKEVNWKTGVKAAWTVDIDQQKIIPLSTRDIVCYRHTPP
jgi:hypothetical protein